MPESPPAPLPPGRFLVAVHPPEPLSPRGEQILRWILEGRLLVVLRQRLGDEFLAETWAAAADLAEQLRRP